jgi:hypothetical protein
MYIGQRIRDKDGVRLVVNLVNEPPGTVVREAMGKHPAKILKEGRVTAQTIFFANNTELKEFTEILKKGEDNA